MNGWSVLLVPIIFLVLYLLHTLASAKQPPPRGQPGRPFDPGRGEAARRRPRTDLERFLEEMRQRRETAESQSAPSEEAEPTADAERRSAPQAERRTPRPVKPEPEPAILEALPVVEVPALRRAARRTPSELPRQRPVQQAPPRKRPPQPAVDVEALPAALPVEQAPEAIPPVIAPVATERGSRKLDVRSPVGQLVLMLQSPSSLAAAIVLREVLDPPLCMRPGFGGPRLRTW